MHVLHHPHREGTRYERAVPPLVDRVRGYVEAGIRDIKLTGQDTAAYGMDCGTSLADLLRDVCRVDGEFRLRVGMMDPLTVLPILDDLVDAYRSPKMYKFLHLPVQSGDDGILAARREYAVADFERIVARFRATIPEVTLSTDIIVGFPGETDGTVLKTLNLLRRVRPDVVNVTRFSPRPGTPAAAWKAPVGWRVKEWSRRIAIEKSQIGRDINASYVGRRLPVLTTEPGKPGTTLSRTDNYKQVVLPGEVPIGEFRSAVVRRATDVDLVASPA